MTFGKDAPPLPMYERKVLRHVPTMVRRRYDRDLDNKLDDTIGTNALNYYSVFDLFSVLFLWDDGIFSSNWIVKLILTHKVYSNNTISHEIELCYI